MQHAHRSSIQFGNIEIEIALRDARAGCGFTIASARSANGSIFLRVRLPFLRDHNGE